MRSQTVSWDKNCNERDERLLLLLQRMMMMMFMTRRWEVFFFLFLSQTLDQDLWVVGDRSREEGVPSRFGRGTGMCPLIRLGNCGGRETG